MKKEHDPSLDQKYFDDPDLDVIEWLILSTTDIGQKEKEMLIGIAKGFITVAQKRTVLGLVKKYRSEFHSQNTQFPSLDQKYDDLDVI